ncbi:MAG TPA: S9 family peptidase, partial [Bacteroidetes bacterium]|nr:S9 family peptidase [Bacteroidota bacterium]
PLTLSVDLIMRNPKWIGSSPGDPYWSEDSKRIYFMWNPEGAESDSLYVVSARGGQPRKVTAAEQKKLPSRFGVYNRKRSEKVYAKEGDIFLFNLKTMQEFQITRTTETERNPFFSGDEQKVIFSKNNNMYMWYKKDGKMVQLTDFRKGKKRPEQQEPRSPQEKWLKQEELKLIRVLKERHEKAEEARKRREKEVQKKPKTIYLGEKRVKNILLSPDETVVTFLLSKSPKGNKRTIVPNYVTETGFTTDIPGRTKVGAAQPSYRMGIYNIQKDTVIYLATEDIPGIHEKPSFLQDYPKKKTAKKSEKENRGKMTPTKKEKERGVYFQGPYWSDDGRHVVIVAFAQDNKDRWLLLLAPQTGKLRNLDRQHDEAWIGGPGVRGWRRSQNVGWLPDNRRFWFQSEATGYSHLYTVDVVTGKKTQLTSGKFEVFSPRVSRDKKQWYFTSSEVHPGERHFYRMPRNGGKRTQITTLTGNNQVIMSPDEKMLAVRYSYSNVPWELYIMPNKPGAKPVQTISFLTDEFKSYPWRDPEMVQFKARDGAGVYARLYRPENPKAKGPAVVFVHGAGYLQNAHKWWSSYFREYMFHNLLVDHGYTVLDMDYRGSAGYGRDWRTAVYRHMGGKDLTDQVDGVKYLVKKYDVDPKRVGIYGGSYGGFITLMAMFTTPDVFACGAALRPVTDWAHYNNGYTANILNVPFLDSLAYVRSSPIYFAEGLEGALLICHGMVDTNVHFQDVVRLAQRLIELGKENWQVAIYPVESHGFREPSSWTDEYKRIFKLFEENLK